MNFYTKVVSKHAANPDLRLTVGFEVAVNEDEAPNRERETRAALRDLGLSVVDRPWQVVAATLTMARRVSQGGGLGVHQDSEDQPWRGHEDHRGRLRQPPHRLVVNPPRDDPGKDLEGPEFDGTSPERDSDDERSHAGNQDSEHERARTHDGILPGHA